MVGVLDVLAILLGSLGAQVVGIVLLGKLTLHQGRIGNLVLELLQAFNGHRGVHVEISVGILHIGLDVVGILVKGQLIDAGCIAPVLLVGLGVGFKDVAVGVIGIPLAGILNALLNVLGIGGGICIIVSACNLHLQLGILLGHLAGLFEQSLHVTAIFQCDSSLTHIVVGIHGVGCDTFLKVGGSLGNLTLVQGNLAEIVVGFCLIGAGRVQIALEQLLGIVQFVNLVVLNTVLVALCVGYQGCTHQHE